MSDADPEEGRDRSRERLVRIATFDNIVDAAVSRDTLEQAGIASFLKNVDALSAPRGTGLPLAQDLYVLEGDVEAAQELLAAESEQPHRPAHHHRHRRPRPHR